MLPVAKRVDNDDNAKAQNFKPPLPGVAAAPRIAAELADSQAANRTRWPGLVLSGKFLP